MVHHQVGMIYDKTPEYGMTTSVKDSLHSVCQYRVWPKYSGHRGSSLGLAKRDTFTQTSLEGCAE